MPLLAYILYMERGAVTAYFGQEHDTHTETGKFIYKALTLHDIQLLLKCDATKVQHIALFTLIP